MSTTSCLLRHPRRLEHRGLRLAQLPARQGKAALTVALGDFDAGPEAPKVLVKKAVWHCTRDDKAACKLLFGLLKRNRWAEASFLHRLMRKHWRGGRSRVDNQIMADEDSYTAKIRHGEWATCCPPKTTTARSRASGVDGSEGRL